MGESDKDTSQNSASKKEEEKAAKGAASFSKLAKKIGLKDASVKLLTDNDYDSAEALVTISSQELGLLGLSMGQNGLLRKWLAGQEGPEHVQSQTDIKTPEEKAKPEAKPEEHLEDNPASEAAAGAEAVAGACSKQAGAMLGPAELSSLLQTLATGASTRQTTDVEGDQPGRLHVPLKDRKIKKLNRAHEFISGKTAGHELNLREFMYGNLLMLENMVCAKLPDQMNYVKHLSFLMLKSMQGYTTGSLVDYDYGLRDQLEYSTSAVWPDESSADLMNRFMKLAPTTPSKGGYASPSHTTTLSGRCMRWNNSDDGSACKDKKKCKWVHACLICGQDHTVKKCPKADGDSKGKPASTQKSSA